MANDIVRVGRVSSLSDYHDPSLAPGLVELSAWEFLFPTNALFVRPLSKADVLFHETETGGYGVFNQDGKLVTRKGSLEAAVEWIEIDGSIPMLML
jgi:hypothetical protein